MSPHQIFSSCSHHKISIRLHQLAVNFVRGKCFAQITIRTSTWDQVSVATAHHLTSYIACCMLSLQELPTTKKIKLTRKLHPRGLNVRNAAHTKLAWKLYTYLFLIHVCYRICLKFRKCGCLRSQ
jgi:hypothetical protein